MAVSAALVRPAAGQPVEPAGPEFQINTYTTSYQIRPVVSLDATGDFVVVWTSFGSSGTDSSSFSIQGQRFAADGTPRGSEFQVNTYTTGFQLDPSVATEPDGDFVVVWVSDGSYGTDSAGGYSVQGQRYAADGTPRGGQFQVNTYTTSVQGQPIVSADAAGNFVVVWTSLGSAGTDSSYSSVQGQRYASDGTPLGGEFQVNNYTTGYQSRPSVSAYSDGSFVVAWQSNGSPGNDSGYASIQGRRFASNGTPLGNQFQVNTFTQKNQAMPWVSVSEQGQFVVVWQSNGSGGTDSSYYSVQGQRYAGDGSPLGGEFQVNSFTESSQLRPAVSSDRHGAFVVVWHGDGSAGTDTASFSIQAQHYADDGSPLGGEFQVNSFTSGIQTHPTVSFDSRGHFVVAWRSDGSSGTDSSAASIQGQRYASPDFMRMFVAEATGDGTRRPVAPATLGGSAGGPGE